MSPNRSEPWVSRSFIKDTKLRTVERYWRGSNDLLSSIHTSQIVARILPDARTLRKYLRLIRTLTTEYHDLPFQWILTESAVELMDHRNQSLQEAAAPQERNGVQRLVQQSTAVFAFADLSVRQEHDEWNFLHYESMTLTERSRQAHVRAAGLIAAAHGPPCWLLVDDDENDFSNLLPLDDDANMKYLRVQDFIDNLATRLSSKMHVERLNEIKRSCSEEYMRRNAQPDSDVNPNDELLNLSAEEIREHLKTGKLLRGRLNVTKENIRESYVTAGNQTLFVDHSNVNHTFHQDVVIIEPLPESKWGRPIGKRRLVYNVGDDEDSGESALDSAVPAVPSARVVCLDRPGRRVYVTTMIDMPNADEGAVLVIPMDMRIPKIRIRTRTWRRFEGQRLKVEVTAWEVGSQYPAGRCVEVLGPIGDVEVEIKALLIENQVELEPFSAEALACLPVEGSSWRVPDEEIQRRRDLRRSRRIFSVDPPGCQDIDDAMHAEILPNGDVEVGVHIADVTHFVKHKSQLDKEAQLRGTTFYLVDRRFDMLPSLLSSDLCSLHGGIDRLALTAIVVLSNDLKVVKSTWFGRTVIHNCAAMTYDQADNILHDRPPDELEKPLPPRLTAGSPVDLKIIKSLKQDLTILTRLARKLRKDREEIGGAVDLTSGESGSELKFTLESGKPTKVLPKQDKEIHHTIAELMIMANTQVATLIYKSFPDAALFRTHRPVEESRLEELRSILEAAGVVLNSCDGSSLAKSLKEASRKQRPKNSSFQTLLLSVATRSMTEAQYICTGDRKEGSDLSHYGLGLEKYTHFTSPIRRYCDVVVHKQLLESLSDEFATRRRGRTEAKAKQVHLEPLASLPDSSVISILAGEGMRENSIGDEEEDEQMDGAAYPMLLTDPTTQLNEAVTEEMPQKPYIKSEVSSICEGLNLHSRLAKHSAYECQSLFLSLYFREHADKTQAVVTNLRENGFLVYVPKYDINGPVYIRDTNGDVQIDPLLLGLPHDCGLAPTMGFTSSGYCRRFPDGDCKLFDGPDARLEVRLTDSSEIFVLRVFDVVDVELTCANWDVRARVPAPRLQLSASRTHEVSTENISPNYVHVTSDKLNQIQSRTTEPVKEGDASTEGTSLFNVLTNLKKRRPDLPEVPLRSARSGIEMPGRKELLRGRVIYGDFSNPDTRQAAQEAAQQAAAVEAAHRRAHMLESSTRRNEFNTVSSIERNVTMRQQRLAADKRNTRRSKAK